MIAVARRIESWRAANPPRILQFDQRKEWYLWRLDPSSCSCWASTAPNFHGEIIAELERLRESDTVRVIDALAVYKDADGEIGVEHLSNLSEDEAIELGSKVGALVGLGIEGEEGFEAGAEIGRRGRRQRRPGVLRRGRVGRHRRHPQRLGRRALLIEHHWAVPLRDAVARAGGYRLADGFISPLDLVEIGLVTAEEAEQLHAQETAATAGAR